MKPCIYDFYLFFINVLKCATFDFRLIARIRFRFNKAIKQRETFPRNPVVVCCYYAMYELVRACEGK